MLLAYVGPETTLPLVSILAGVLGFVMLVGKSAVSAVAGVFRRRSAVPPTRRPAPNAESEPASDIRAKA